MSDQRIIVFDTTLRDGEQCPGAALSVEQKLAIAHQLAKLNVDVIEAGFPVSSDAQFEAVKVIAEQVREPVICGLARCVDLDIDKAAAALEKAAKPRIHTFIATSKIHLDKKFRKSEEEVLEMAIQGITRAKKYFSDIEFSPEDSSRTGKPFLFRIIQAAIDAGATTINIPDTVGYSNPDEFGQLIREIFQNVPNIHKAVLSVHCHNDLGLATANTLAAVRNGAQQVEVTINGIGERAGNASLEEVVMALKTRYDFYQKTTGIRYEEIVKTSRLVSNLTGIPVQPNKAVVGANAFAHESGIHQDAMIKDAATYEIMNPAEVGWGETKIVLGRHSGRHGLKKRLEDLGYSLSQEKIDRIYKRFLEIADKKKEVFDADLEALVSEEAQTIEEVYQLEYFHILSGNHTVPTATIGLRIGDQIVQDAAVGDGPIDAAFAAIDKIIGRPVKLLEFSLQALTGGRNAMGEVHVTITENGRKFVGRGTGTDVIEAGIRAYIHAHNKLYSASESKSKG
ncbi:MAG: 2-isopropylmalate synthase [candidate division KSB1 bacterium]|nr:2-isopropylmalate synthase [candidate division KSB1 bacterium]